MSDSPISPEKTSPALPKISPESSIHLKCEGERLVLIWPAVSASEADVDWLAIWQSFKRSLLGRQGDWPQNTAVDLQAHNHLLDNRQLQTLVETLTEAGLKLHRVYTTRRQTAVVVASAGLSVEQQTLQPALFPEEPAPTSAELAEPLYLQTTIRSGVEIRHAGTVILAGDLNPGGMVIATGDICVWGRLRGVAHAGAQGNRACQIMALQMEATQLRIAEVVARLPKATPDQFEPEVAYITSQGIRLGRALNFAKTHSFSAATGSWTASEPLPLITH